MNELDQSAELELTRREALELCAGLRAYIRAMEQHAADDPTGSHPEENLNRLRLHLGQLIWRLEEVALSHLEGAEHSEDAVSPKTSVEWP